MAKCEICGKSPMFGHNVSHSKRATKRMFRPNIQHKRAQARYVLKGNRLFCRIMPKELIISRFGMQIMH